MRVCMDGLPYFLNKWDLGEYSRELISKLSKESSLSLHLLKDKEIKKDLRNFDTDSINIFSLSLDRINDNYTPLVNYLESYNIDVYHCLNNGFSISKNMDFTKIVTTFHCLIPLEHEEYFKDSYKNKFFKTLPLALSKTNKFIVPSKSMRNKLIHLCNVPKENVEVVYPIIGKSFESKNKYMSLVYLRSKFNINDDFILFTGDLHKRKRIEELIEVFFRVSHSNESLKLIFLTHINEVNIDYFNELNIIIKSMCLSSKVQFITSFTREEKIYFLNGATCLIDLSIFDDMNISMIQALLCECPVICSDIPLHREILGDSGIFIDMQNINSLDFIEHYIHNIKDINLYNPKDHLSTIENFNINTNVNKLVNIYLNI